LKLNTNNAITYVESRTRMRMQLIMVVITSTAAVCAGLAIGSTLITLNL